MPLIMKDGKAYGQSPSGLSGLIDTDIQNPSANQLLAYDGSKWDNVTPIHILVVLTIQMGQLLGEKF